MKNPLEATVYKWLKLLDIHVAKSYLEEKIGTHPEYPSLLSITDTVKELGIHCEALVIDPNTIQEVEVPVLVYVKSKGGEFLLAKNLQRFSRDTPSFLEMWSGIIVVAEKEASWKNHENEQRRKQEISIAGKMLFPAGILLLPVLMLLQQHHFVNLLPLLTTLAGISIMFLIVQKELGYNNKFTDRLCRAGTQTDCDAVMHSKGAAILGWIDWADLGIIYFSAAWLLEAVSIFTNDLHYSTKIIFVTTTAALPFTLLSMYYQWQQVKKWCVLCLLTSLVLWLQFLLLLPVLPGDKWKNIPVNSYCLTAFLFLFAACVWLLLMKPLLGQRKDWREKVWPLLRLKRNPETFLSLLTKERKVDTTPFAHDLCLGNAAAPVQIMVACGTYCAPCARAHKELHELLLVHRNDVGITIRFAVNGADESNKRTKATRYILETWLESNEYKQVLEKNNLAEELLNDWFNWMDIEKFTTKYHVTGQCNGTDLLALHDNWVKTAGISHTPTFFINGYELPRLYTIRDVSNIIPSLTELITLVAADAYAANQGSGSVKVTGFVPDIKIEASLNFNK